MMQFLMSLNDTFSGFWRNILVITLLPKVQQAYSLVIQDETRQMTLETTRTFSIAVVIQSHSIGSQNRHCDCCDCTGHVIANYRQLKFHNNFCGRNGHTEDTFRFKDGTYASSGQGHRAQNDNHGSNWGANSRQNSNFFGRNMCTFAQQSHTFVPHIGLSFPFAHATQQADNWWQDPIQALDFLAQTLLNGLTFEQYQQLAIAMSHVTTNASSSGDNHALVNATCLFNSLNSICSQDRKSVV